MRLSELNEEINLAKQAKSLAQLASDVLTTVNQKLPDVQGFKEFSDILSALDAAIKVSRGEKDASDKIFGIFANDERSPATKAIINKINAYIRAASVRYMDDPDGRQVLRAARESVVANSRYKEARDQDDEDDLDEGSAHLRATAPKPKRQKAGGTKNPARGKMVGEEVKTKMRRPTTTWFMEEIIGVDAAKKRDGVFRVARGFFYRSGGTPEAFAERISKQLDKMEVNYRILDSGEVYGTGFKGGASTWRQDHWWVDLEILDDKVPYSVMVDEDLAEKKAKCWKGYERVPGTEPYSKGSCRKK